MHRKTAPGRVDVLTGEWSIQLFSELRHHTNMTKFSSDINKAELTVYKIKHISKTICEYISKKLKSCNKIVLINEYLYYNLFSCFHELNKQTLV